MSKISNIEFLNVPKTGKLMYRCGATTMVYLTEHDHEIIDYVHDYIKTRYSDAFGRLEASYVGLSMNPGYKKFRQVVRFCKCNFSNFDETQFDIDETGNFNLEVICCPRRGGDCSDEGVICNPKLTLDISDSEMEVFRLLKSGLNYEQMAELLKRSPYTIKHHAEALRKKIGVQTNDQLISFWFTNRLH